MKNVLLRAINIHKTFVLDKKSGSKLHVLKGIDLDVSEGEFISIVGASGSGKSTLLHILGGLDRPTEGTVLWLDEDIASLNDETLAKLRASNVGFVFQFHHLLPEFTALENVMIPMMIHGGSRGLSRFQPKADEPLAQRDEADGRAKELLERVGLSERMNHKPGELSGGEQQRVAVARALANRPKIIFADEPTGNLDSANSQQIHDLLLELNKTERQTFVLVTHNERFAEHSDRVFRMEDGKLRAV